MSSQVKPPDLLIYLKASIPTLVDHIQTRGRDYEGSMSLDYLQKLNRRYESWIETYNTGKLLIVDVDKLNFIQNKEDLGFIIELIDGELNGLFS
jgi:deoxyadenosine/deoxycytidine kinase